MNEQPLHTPLDESVIPDVWRDEVQARLERYKKRRGRRIEGAFTMRFPFPVEEPAEAAPEEYQEIQPAERFVQAVTDDVAATENGEAAPIVVEKPGEAAPIIVEKPAETVKEIRTEEKKAEPTLETAQADAGDRVGCGERRADNRTCTGGRTASPDRTPSATLTAAKGDCVSQSFVCAERSRSTHRRSGTA